jgi:hypothetical protein
MNHGQIRWDPYHTDKPKEHQVRQVRRHPGAESGREALPRSFALKNCQKVDLAFLMQMPLGKAVARSTAP